MRKKRILKIDYSKILLPLKYLKRSSLHYSVVKTYIRQSAIRSLATCGLCGVKVAKKQNNSSGRPNGLTRRCISASQLNASGNCTQLTPKPAACLLYACGFVGGFATSVRARTQWLICRRLQQRTRLHGSKQTRSCSERGRMPDAEAEIYLRVSAARFVRQVHPVDPASSQRERRC